MALPLNKPFSFAGREFDHLNPFVIAEIGVNHEGSLDRAKEMIRQVARSGAHAAKFQSYSSDKLAARQNSPAYWDTTKEPTESQYTLFQKYDSFTPDDYAALAEECESVGVAFMSTPFDLDVVDVIDQLAPLFKIASADLTNVPLLRKVACTGKPVILSTGAATMQEIDAALAVLKSSGAVHVSLLHCVLNYPTPKENANLGVIRTLVHAFGDKHSVGYSDHVAPNDDGAMPALEIATLYGANILEKHFTDDRSAPGNDHYHATDEAGFREFFGRLSEFSELHGSDEINLSTQNAAIQNARRRIFTKDALKAGQILSESHLIPLRANEGIEVSNWDDVVGKVLAKDLAENAAVTWQHLG